MQESNARGFTLVELLVAVAALGIVAAIAYPSYQASVMKARRADAKIALSEVANLQERFFAEKSTYSNSLSDNTADSCTSIVYRSGTSSPEGYYTLAINTSAAPAFDTSGGNCDVTAAVTDFSIAATATGAQAEDNDCTSFTLNSLGVKSASPDPDSKCW